MTGAGFRLSRSGLSAGAEPTSHHSQKSYTERSETKSVESSTGGIKEQRTLASCGCAEGERVCVCVSESGDVCMCECVC